MRGLIVNADDFGLHGKVNEGIMAAFEAGAITSATLMVKREGAGEAIRYLQANPGFPAGLHLDLDAVILDDRTGAARFEKACLAETLADIRVLEEAKKEIKNQIALFKETGIEFTHIDGHHHLHALPELFPSLIEIMADEEIGAVRFSKVYDLVKYPPFELEESLFSEFKQSMKAHGIKSPDHFTGPLNEEELKKLPKAVTESMVHPGLGEAWREAELGALTAKERLDAIKNEGITLLSYRDLADLAPSGSKNGKGFQ